MQDIIAVVQQSSELKMMTASHNCHNWKNLVTILHYIQTARLEYTSINKTLQIHCQAALQIQIQIEYTSINKTLQIHCQAAIHCHYAPS